MRTTLRLFIAVPVPQAVAAFLETLRRQWRDPKRNLRWVPTQNIHLTLQFLGDVETTAIASISEQMDAVAAASPPFSLAAKGVGGFPRLRQLRVLWVGLDGETQRLIAIQGALAKRLETVGFARERRRFHPHLTIGRARRPMDGRRLSERLMSSGDLASGPFRVDRICLVASRLTSKGAEYSCVHTSHLLADANRRGVADSDAQQR